jgi:hypothetical protein
MPDPTALCEWELGVSITEEPTDYDGHAFRPSPLSVTA